jgi:hypothetical protein
MKKELQNHISALKFNGSFLLIVLILGILTGLIEKNISMTLAALTISIFPVINIFQIVNNLKKISENYL